MVQALHPTPATDDRERDRTSGGAAGPPLACGMTVRPVPAILRPDAMGRRHPQIRARRRGLDILLLSPCLPYPPSRGDRSRAWHILEHLARRHSVHLGAFMDDPSDGAHLPALRPLCASLCLRPLGRWHQLVRLPGIFLGGQALSIGIYNDPSLRRWVQGLLQGRIDLVLALSTAGAFFLIDRRKRRPAILDLATCESERWRHEAAAARWPWRGLLAREHRLVRSFERAAAWYFDDTLLVSAAEAELLRIIAPESAARIGALGTGVDTSFYDPALVRANPYPADGRLTVIFTGTMNEATDIEAALWFAAKVMPRLRAQAVPARFAVVGPSPTPAVRRLARQPDILVSGAVADLRPWLRYAAVAVAPLRHARALQGRVLDGMAMALPVVATPVATNGIDAVPGDHLLLADDAAGFAEAVLELVRAPQRARELGAAARRRVVERHAWTRQLLVLDQILARAAGRAGD